MEVNLVDLPSYRMTRRFLKDEDFAVFLGRIFSDPAVL